MESIEKILNIKKVRYEYMDELFKKFSKSLPKEGNVNIFIDVPSTIKQLYNPQNLNLLSTNINTTQKYCIASCLLNMIGHYRHYFASHWQNYTNIYFMYNSKMDKEIIGHYDKNYKKTYYEKRINLNNDVFGNINTVIKDNFRIMSIIIDSIPHAYFIDTGDIDYRCIFNYIIKNNSYEEDLNIILTTDDIFYQSVTFNNTLILEPKSDKSRIVYYNNVMKYIGNKNKTFEKNPEYLWINPENITLLNALVNQKDYDIEGIRKFGYTKAIVFLNKNNIDVSISIKNEKTIEEMFKDILNEEEIKKVQNNLSIFNNEYLMERNERKLDLIIEKQMKFVYTPNDLKKVNEKYFKRYPLILDFMFEGENIDD